MTEVHDTEVKATGDDVRIEEVARALLEKAPSALAVTRGRDHVLVAANDVFRKFVARDADWLGLPVSEIESIGALKEWLDFAFNDAVTLRDRSFDAANLGHVTWSCTVWPHMAGEESVDGLVIQLRPTDPRDSILALQREVAERLLIGALRQNLIAEASRRLASSIDEESTRRTISELYLPDSASWCIVDLVDGGKMQRLAIVHPDPVKQKAARKLAPHWIPKPGDLFGAPAILHKPVPLGVTRNVNDALSLSALDAEQLAVLHDLGIGSLLTVPMITRDRLLGAITFVGEAREHPYTRDEIDVAQELAFHGALAIDTARMYAEAIEHKARAEKSSHAKSRFLAHISHELRTSLNAIGGFIDILDLELHGPLNEQQHSDVERIRRNQQHLAIMIDDVLSFMQAESGSLSYHSIDLAVNSTLSAAASLLEPIIVRKRVLVRHVRCSDDITAYADPSRTQQILLNLISNAVKYTPEGGEIKLECEATEETVFMKVTDTGVGIPPDELETVFEPFVRLPNPGDPSDGAGLGLAISRDLARAMHGDIRAESMPVGGSVFTLSLPRGRARAQQVNRG